MRHVAPKAAMEWARQNATHDLEDHPLVVEGRSPYLLPRTPGRPRDHPRRIHQDDFSHRSRGSPCGSISGSLSDLLGSILLSIIGRVLCTTAPGLQHPSSWEWEKGYASTWMVFSISVPISHF